MVEAFRSIRLNLAHSYSPSGAILLTISSPGAGDGKSVVSTNLALSFAEAGYRTVLLDGDTRRGELHRTFAAERRPGLLDHLAGSAGSSQITRTTSHANLTLIPCGSRKQSGPELLGSARMSALMTSLRESYDVVIVDSPPLGAGIDPFVLGTLTGNLMLVLRAGETDRAMAESRLKIIDRLPIRLLGAVLNDIRAAGGIYKYYSYLSGYAAEEELADGNALPSVVPSKAGD
jgi:tyrosine-protein kinase Etk/Wzc